MNQKIHCQLMISSFGAQIEQIYTGFHLLRQQGRITFSCEKDARFQAGAGSPPFLKVVVNDTIKLVYDMFDGKRINQELLAWADLYFKRSKTAEMDAKVLPAGFNYLVYAPRDPLLFRKLFWSLPAGISKKTVVPFLHSSFLLSKLLRSDGKSTALISQFEGVPNPDDDVRILFNARLWDPESRVDSEGRKEINQLRSETIRKLRQEFPEKFIGGLYPDKLSEQLYPELVLPSKNVRKDVYLSQVKRSQICIATQGLFHSNGWKLAEYIAGAKAIVSEPLYYQVPGDFLPEKNYLVFTTPEECVAQVRRLIEDPQLRYQIMQNNFDYYHAYLRPDMLVWNTLQQALSRI